MLLLEDPPESASTKASQYPPQRRHQTTPSIPTKLRLHLRTEKPGVAQPDCGIVWACLGFSGLKPLTDKKHAGRGNGHHKPQTSQKPLGTLYRCFSVDSFSPQPTHGLLWFGREAPQEQAKFGRADPFATRGTSSRAGAIENPSRASPAASRVTFVHFVTELERSQNERAKRNTCSRLFVGLESERSSSVLGSETWKRT